MQGLADPWAPGQVRRIQLYGKWEDCLVVERATVNSWWIKRPRKAALVDMLEQTPSVLLSARPTCKDPEERKEVT